jgi:hypothetical protein
MPTAAIATVVEAAMVVLMIDADDCLSWDCVPF